MSIALSEFWKRLVHSGITDSDGCREIAAAYSRAHDGSPPSEAKRLAKFLVKDSKLSKFQARALLATEARDLRIGDWSIVERRAAAPFSNWYQVKHLRDHREGVLFRASAQSLAGGRDLWLDAHQSLEGPSLQPVECVVEESSSLVFSALPPGQTLLEMVKERGSLPPSQVVELGITLSRALQTLHARPMVHGGLRLDRVWIGRDQSVVLLRDPSGPAVTPWEATTHAWLETLDPPAAYAAPEFVDRSHACDVSTDIYSLGCLLFRLLTGRPVVSVDDVSQALSMHASETPTEISQALELREQGDPLFRVLAYALAKTPQARFASAEQLASALEAIRGLVDDTVAIPSQADDSADRKSEPAIADVASQAMSTGASRSKKQSNAANTKTRSDKASANRESPPRKSDTSSGRSDKKGQKSEGKTSVKSDAEFRSDSRTRSRSRKEDNRSVTKQKSPAHGSTNGKPTPKDKSNSKKQGASEKGSVPDHSIASSGKRAVSDDPNPNADKLTDGACVRETSGGAPPKVVAGGAPPKVVVTTDVNEEIDFGAEANSATEPVTNSSPTPPPVSESTAVAAPEVASSSVGTEPPPLPVDVEVPANAGASIAEGLSETESSSSPQPPDRQESRASAKPTVRKRRKKKDRKAPIILGGLCVAVLVLLLGQFVPTGSDEVVETPRRRPPVPANIPSVTNKPAEEPSTEPETVPGYQLVSDDSLLYVPPYAADSPLPPLELLPPGPAVIVSWRADKILDGGRELVESMSPDLTDLMQAATSMSKIPLEEMKRCTVALHPGEAGWPEVSLSIELATPKPSKELIELWDVIETRTPTGATLYADDSDEPSGYYFPESPDDLVSRFAVGSMSRIGEVAEAEGGPIPLPRSLQKLWDGASAEAALVALITPNFLFADGREMLRSSLPEMVDPLKSVLIPDVAAALLTIQIGSDFYFLETRLTPSGSASEAALLRKLEGAIESWPTWAEDFIVTSVPDSSWRLLATRLPSMMRFVAEQFRFGIVDGTIVANTYLPSDAVPQLSVAVAFAMNTATQPSVASAVQEDPPLTIDQMLDRKMSVSFDQESLEFALNAITQAFKDDLPKNSTMPTATILGSDLEKAGITQNQQVRDFAKEDLPLRTVLTDLVMGANSDKTVTDPSDPKQALIWVVGKGPSGQTEILITTRAAAADKYDLPKEFKADGN